MKTLGRIRASAAILLALVTLAWAMPVAAQHHHGEGTPAAWSCDAPGTPMAGPHGEHGMMEPASTPDTAPVEVDLLYIDMMLPHHESIIALSEAALPHLTDSRLVEIAGGIIAAQTAENEQLSAWREGWYGSPEPDTSEGRMMAMLEVMPVGSMDEMMQEMDSQWQVSTFCAAETPDIAFIHQAIRHHQMAVEASEAVLDRLVHPELVGFAQGVIEDQQAEIDVLNGILAEIEAATPAS